ncbi:uncharacterized protein LOC117172667 isoform X2 [Belonocnema kinseyi]|uniref:uncharacterized protein LOC117172667 isoform X2 n=1 Tax=Belonocnema kinseyi TaxID=2817044 RepID=UPI00143D25D6|nr:uncharacterized protein LOC117172667 isoform X2 [Belonocnema kinseyi]
MKIIAATALLAFVGFLHFKCTGGFPANHVFIEMTDHSTFEGMINPFTHRDLPLWMQPGHAHHVLDFYAFIRTETGAHFTSIVATTNRPFNHDPRPNGPVYAELRLGNVQF